MKKLSEAAGAVLAVVLIIFLWTCCASAQEINVCEIYAQEDAETLLKTAVTDVKFRNTMMPAGQSCRYSYTKDGGTYWVTVKISTDAEIQKEGINASAKDLMERQQKARKAHAYASQTLKTINDLGNDAFWNGRDLWILAGDKLVVISVSSYLGGMFADAEAAKRAREQQDLTLSAEVAQLVLQRLK